METLIAFGIAFAITLVFVWHYMSGIRKSAPGAAPAAPPVAARPCPRCSAAVALKAAFCAQCGAPLALWTVHSAEISDGAMPAEKGQPRPVINASLCIGCGSCVEVCPEQGTLAMAGGKAILANPERCKGHAACVSACPTSGITLAYGNVRQTLRVPLVRENFETNVPGLFVAGELGGLGLIKTSINEGRLVGDHLKARLCDRHDLPALSEDDYDVIVVGAGPAGLSASLTLHQHGIRYLTLEQGEIAATIRNYPRHKFLMAEPIEMPLYGNLYIADSTKEALLEVWQTIIANTGVRIRTQEKVESLRRDPETQLFAVTTPRGCYRSRFVVLAIGKRGTPRRLNVPGEDQSHVAYRLIEAEAYENCQVAVIGGGDSAIEAALALARDGRNQVTLIHRGPDFQRAKDRNRASLEKAEAEARVRILREARTTAILPQAVEVQLAQGAEQVPARFVIVLVGGESPEDFLLKSGVEIVEKAIAA